VEKCHIVLWRVIPTLNQFRNVSVLRMDLRLAGGSHGIECGHHACVCVWQAHLRWCLCWRWPSPTARQTRILIIFRRRRQLRDREERPGSARRTPNATWSWERRASDCTTAADVASACAIHWKDRQKGRPAETGCARGTPVPATRVRPATANM